MGRTSRPPNRTSETYGTLLTCPITSKVFRSSTATIEVTTDQLLVFLSNQLHQNAEERVCRNFEACRLYSWCCLKAVGILPPASKFQHREVGNALKKAIWQDVDINTSFSESIEALIAEHDVMDQLEQLTAKTRPLRVQQEFPNPAACCSACNHYHLLQGLLSARI